MNTYKHQLTKNYIKIIHFYIMLAEVRQKGVYILLTLVKKEKGAYVNQTFYTLCLILM